MNEKKLLREKAKKLSPTIWVGKKGIDDVLIAEIKKQLKNRKLLKVKLLPSALEGNDRKKMAAHLAEAAGGVLIDCVGHMVVIAEKP